MKKWPLLLGLFLLTIGALSLEVYGETVRSDWILNENEENEESEENRLQLSTRRGDRQSQFSYCANLAYGDEDCPEAEFAYNKVEGDWWVYARQGAGRNTETALKHFIHDLTPPLCNLTDAPGGTVDITQERGLNGLWANKPLVVYPECTDFIKTDTFNPDFCSTIQVAGRTLYHGSGIPDNNPIQVTDYAGNIGRCELDVIPQVDLLPPIFSGMKIQHVGLGLPIEPLSNNLSSPNEYRAHDGAIKILLSLKDDEDTDKGRSGVSGLSFVSDTGTDKSEPFTRVVLKQIQNESGTLDPLSQRIIEIDRVTQKSATTYEANLNVKFDPTDAYPALSQAGLYTLQSFIVDKATNEVISDKRYIRIYPSNVGEMNSSFYNKQTKKEGDTFDLANCIEETKKTESLFANAAHACDIQYELLDSYKNKLTQRAVKTISVAGQNMDGTYSLLEDETEAFTNGLRLTNASGIVLDDQARSHFEVKALLPTVLLEKTPENERARNIKVRPRTVLFDFSVTSVDKRGRATTSVDNISLGTDLVFLPWLRTTIINNGDSKVALQEQQEYTVLLSTTNTDNLPIPCDVNLYGYPPSGTQFTNASFGRNTALPFTYNKGGSNNESKAFETVLSARSDGGQISEGGLVLVSDLTCALTGKEITYPGGILGGDLFDDCRNCTEGVDFEPFAIQADIEGDVLGIVSYTDIKERDENIRTLGQYNKKDIRQEITQNAFSIIRSQEPLNALNEKQIDLTSVSFGDNEVRYYRGVDVLLSGGAITGVGTIVVEDGNIIIAGDIGYENTQSSLGVIAVNTTQSPSPSTGNIYIKRDVQSFVGSYFGDGSVLSYISTPGDLRSVVPKDGYVVALEDLPTLADPSSDTVALSDNPLGKQLVLHGTLLTRNTLGGDNFDPRYTPWGAVTKTGDARLYDMHYLRRYTPERILEEKDKEGNVIKAESIVLSDKDNRYCLKRAGKCDRNENAFVIRTDRKVNTLPPPGFKVQATIGR